MSDSVKKYYEDLEDANSQEQKIVDKEMKEFASKVQGLEKFQLSNKKLEEIFESPDGGDTVTSRPFGADVSEREIVFEKKKAELTEEERKDAYKILAYYSENSVKLAYEILSMSE